MRSRILLLAACAFLLRPIPAWAAVPPPCPGWCGTPPRLALWMEASANLRALSTREGIAGVLDRARAAGVTVVMPEAKNAWGYVTYRSAFAPLIGTSPVPRTAPPSYPAPRAWYPPQFDQLQVIIEEAHKRGIQVHAAVNLFGEGLTAYRVGPLFERPQWAALHLGPSGAIRPSTAVTDIAFANPGLPEVQLYELAVVGEIVRTYDVDGLILDRIRYPDITADFSADSKAAFEQWLGRSVDVWPDDVLRVEGTRHVRGPLFRAWVAWRATVIQRFIRAAERLVHGIKPHVAFTAYMGGWYPAYWNEGTNWGSADTGVNLTWMSAQWREAAAAELFDYLMVGLYYPSVSRADALAAGLPMWMSVEGGALLADDVVAGQTRLVGSLLLPLYEGAPDRFRVALERARRLTSGAMLFDLVYLDRYDWWGLLPGQNH